MTKVYGVLGAGMQGTAAAYDLALYGEAQKVYLADLDLDRAKRQADRINALLSKPIVQPASVDIKDHKRLVQFLTPLDGVLTAAHYLLNLNVTKAAIEAKTHMCDLGGNTDVVFQQLNLSSLAVKSGVTIVPDCGLAPGLGNIFAVHAVETLDTVEEVQIRCGGLPQNPKPPLNYKLVFSIDGLTNEYFGKAHVLRNGKIQEIDTFTELEEIEFDSPVGRCEAFVTSGGTSTCPWSFSGKIKTYEYKTVRYPGHYEKIKFALEMGLLDTKPVKIKNVKISPRDVFHAVVAPRITFEDDKDLVVLRAICRGIQNGTSKTIVLETIDFFDEKTGFTAMERTTAYPAALVLEMLVLGDYASGVVPLEKTISAKEYLPRLEQRGIEIKVK